MERSTPPDRAFAVAAAAAHDFNEELTVILSCISESIDTLPLEHPAQHLLVDARGAIQRCAWMTAALLGFSARPGLRRTAVRMQSLIQG